jgi:hypothetical protein
VNALFAKGKEKLMKDLLNAKYACTTADCWTTRRKSFLGVTVHWLDSNMQVNTLVNIVLKCCVEYSVNCVENVCTFPLCNLAAIAKEITTAIVFFFLLIGTGIAIQKKRSVTTLSPTSDRKTC